MFNREANRSEPSDPSLALCQICANADMRTPARGNDDEIRQYRTCMRWIWGKCNSFVPGNIEGMTLQDRAKMMMEMVQYGRF